MTRARWQLFIDRGGTFTDCIGVHPETGELAVVKVLSSDRAPLEGIRKLLGIRDDEPIPPSDIRMGTTLATNALLERRGCPTALVVTRGFGDLLAIGTQSRPDLFALDIKKPTPLPIATLEVDARLDRDGEVLARPALERVTEELRALRAGGAESVAISILHAYTSSELELELGEAARAAGFGFVALSHAVAPEIGYLARTDTTVLDAYLSPLLEGYVQGLLRELPGSTLRLMQSSGGLTDALAFRGPNAILSGPAGGVVAVAEIARSAGIERAIGFDMGGTSTDVCRFAGTLERVYESEVAGVRVRAPMMRIHTVAAGGGSVCRVHERRLSVGPDSAGAVPGPLSYGHPDASELTLTDVNLLLGRLAPDRFPFPLDAGRARDVLDTLAGRLERRPSEVLEVAEGFFQVANHAMAEAIRRISVARGHDVREHALVVFGGAGGQHACALAKRLGIREILFHPLGGVLSAFGIGRADVLWHGDQDAGRVELSAEALARLEPPFVELERRGRAELEAQGHSRGAIRVERRLDLRYRGSETSLTLDLADAGALAARFHVEHERSFGHARPGHPIEIGVLRVECAVAGARPSVPAPAQSLARGPLRTSRLFVEGRFLDDVPVYFREQLEPSQRIAGPALILESTGSIVVDPGFEAELRADGLLRARDLGDGPPRRARRTELDPVLLEIMQSSFMSIAEQMGEALRRTAFSTNIRERLDYSCALFDADGALVANAPHIPVHLGAMSETVRAIRRLHPEMQPGDAFVSNDPALGGSHLPDITVVSPIHDAAGTLRFFTACRGHHADVGGVSPGSMPAFSTTLAEEGVVLGNARLVHAGRLDRDGILALLASGPYPARDPEASLLDLEAQLAANRTGARLVEELSAEHGLEVVEAYMRHAADDAALRVAAEIAKLPDGEHSFVDALDDGTPVGVTLRVQGDRMQIDFSPSGGEHPGNLNAPRAVTLAAVIYFLRTLVGAPIPLNSGCLRPVELVIPEPSLLAPSPGRAVAGGNVETSQRLVDVLLAAAGRAAASQGTMNNLTFGGAGFSYYETIAGGAGGGPGFEGASAVHTHMTNTRITDPEVLESRFPVRLWRFEIRRGSGGAGLHPGGDGVVRELELLAPARYAILSERRARAPFGLAGGAPGAPGRNRVRGEDVSGAAAGELQPGDRILIETPGGGGFGEPDEQP